jgi:hypothetical protein
MISIAGVDLELFERGQGALIAICTAAAASPDAGFSICSPGRRVFAPSHPGFGKSSLPDWLDCVDDIAHIYLELMDRLGPARPIWWGSRSADGSRPNSPPRRRSGSTGWCSSVRWASRPAPDKLDIRCLRHAAR